MRDSVTTHELKQQSHLPRSVINIYWQTVEFFNFPSEPRGRLSSVWKSKQPLQEYIFARSLQQNPV